MDILSHLKSLSITPLAVYPYGSRVYGNFLEKSDYDFIVVAEIFPEEQLRLNDINIIFYTPNQFQLKLDNHSIDALECIFLEKNKIIHQEINFNFQLDLSKLRSSVCKSSSNSWVKCKKKLIVEKDYDPISAKKSLFHSFRMVEFAIDIAKNKTINDYGISNPLFNEIMNQPNDWEVLKSFYQEKHNNLLSEFRKWAPK